MRDYAKVVPKFWPGETCKALRKKGPEGVIAALYLMTAPGSNMLGIYYQPILYMAHETGLGFEGASKGLQDCIDAGFCSYDADTETVWVHEMASYQIAKQLKASDNRCAGIQRDYDTLPDNPFLGAFFDRYQTCFNLSERREFKAPSKPLRSQEQEQEQEQEEEQEPIGSLLPAKPGTPQCPHLEIVALYHELLPANPAIKVWDGDRAKSLRARWREDPKRQTLDYWRRLFSHVASSPFLTGRVDGANGRPFLPGLDWLVKASNFAKVIEGRYHDKAAA